VKRKWKKENKREEEGSEEEEKGRKVRNEMREDKSERGGTREGIEVWNEEAIQHENERTEWWKIGTEMGWENLRMREQQREKKKKENLRRKEDLTENFWEKDKGRKGLYS
jgi:hypothetical protein